MSDRDIRDELIKDKAFMGLFLQLQNLYLSSFKWLGLPKTINGKYLQKTLLHQGQVAFFKDSIIGPVALSCSSGSSIDLYGESDMINVHGGAYVRQLKNYRHVMNTKENSECVVVYADDVKSVPIDRLRDFAERIFLCERTIDMNIFAQRTPVYMEVEHGQELSVKNLYANYKGFSPVIYGRKNTSMSNDPVKVLKTDAPIVFEKIDDMKRRLWNEALSYIGIENNFSEKNERLVSNEVLVSNGLAIAQRQGRESSLNEGLDFVKELFPELSTIKIEVTNISILDFQIEGGEDNGKVYSDNQNID